MSSSYITKENLPYFDQEEEGKKPEFSKGLTQSMLEANRNRSRAYVEFFLRDIPRAMRNQLAEKFNKAVRSYNANRHKIVDTIHFGYNPNVKLFTVEEQLGTAAAMFQSIEAILHKYPHKKYEEPRSNGSITKEEEDPADKLKRRLAAFGALSVTAMTLAACASSVVAQTEATATQKANPTKDLASSTEDGQEISLTETATAEPSPTLKPTATETPEVSQVDQMLESYLAGEEIDVSSLSPEEFKEFSTKLAEERNKDRGINPVIYNNEAYISPDNYMMMNYDGHPDQNETITMYHAIEGFDAEGNLQINVNGEIITIENSADMDWTMRITDPHDTRIDWPTTKIVKNNLTELQYQISNSVDPCILFPSILLDKDFGQVFISGEKQQMLASSIEMLIIETDSDGNPILARQVMVIGGSQLKLMEEGSSIIEGDGPIMSENEPFYKGLSENSIYYLSIPTDQNFMYEKAFFASPKNYQGLKYGNEAFSILNNETEENNNMLLISAITLVHKK